MWPPRFVLRMPAYLLNGISVAIGVALIQLATGALGGTVAALTASTGAIFGSLPDTPLATSRTWRRVLTGGVIGCVASVLVSLVRVHPLALGVTTALLALFSSLALAWGPRAGPTSFVALLALVFTMAAPPLHGVGPLLVHTGWTVLGAALYLGWATASSRLLQPRLRTLALAQALLAMAALMRSRAALLVRDPLSSDGALPLQDWVQRQVALDERLQAARDLLFPAAERPQEQHRIAMLLMAIEMRDTLLASELDLDHFGRDADAERLRATLAARLDRVAGAIEAMAQALRDRRPAVELIGSLPREAPAESPPVTTPLAVALLNRAGHLDTDLDRMQRAFRGEPVDVPLARGDLALFLSAEGWPLAALRAHMTLASPVLRHALRAGLALGAAYFIALALPWASHPHWLVLSVAVVLRGNLEQTLARRDARVAGTVVGCMLVLAFDLIDSPRLSTIAFLVAVGVAHSFVITRYLVTAAAATVMALMQAHLAHPDGGFGVGERLADTVLGALLAWGFSYVLPWWERRGLARLVQRVLRGLQALSQEALRWQGGAGSGGSDLKLRLARREVFDALGAIAAAAQRTGAEPASVQVPPYALATLLMRSHVLLAQLLAVRLLVTRKADELDAEQAQAVLGAAAAELQALLARPEEVAAGDSRVDSAETTLPPPAAGEALQAWLRRRLQQTALAARGVAQAASAAVAAAS